MAAGVPEISVAAVSKPLMLVGRVMVTGCSAVSAVGTDQTCSSEGAASATQADSRQSMMRRGELRPGLRRLRMSTSDEPRTDQPTMLAHISRLYLLAREPRNPGISIQG